MRYETHMLDRKETDIIKMQSIHILERLCFKYIAFLHCSLVDCLTMKYYFSRVLIVLSYTKTHEGYTFHLVVDELSFNFFFKKAPILIRIFIKVNSKIIRLEKDILVNQLFKIGDSNY